MEAPPRVPVGGVDLSRVDRRWRSFWATRPLVLPIAWGWRRDVLHGVQLEAPLAGWAWRRSSPAAGGLLGLKNLTGAGFGLRLRGSVGFLPMRPPLSLFVALSEAADAGTTAQFDLYTRAALNRGWGLTWRHSAAHDVGFAANGATSYPSGLAHRDDGRLFVHGATVGADRWLSHYTSDASAYRTEQITAGYLSPTEDLHVGGRGGVNTNSNVGNYHLVIAARVALRDADARALTLDPWAPLRTRRRGLVGYVAAATPVPIMGEGAAQLGALTASGSGTVAVAAAGAATLDALTGAAVGTVAVSGYGTGTLSPLTGSASGAVPVSGDGAADLSQLIATGAAAVAIAGDGAAALDPLATDGAGAVRVQGSGTATLGALTAAGSGTVTDTEPEVPPEITGSGTATLDALSGTAAGTVAIAATGAADLAPTTTVAVGAVAMAGDGVAILAALDSLAVGGVLILGFGAATLAALTASGAGTVVTPEPDPWPPTALTVGRITVRPLLSVGPVQVRPLITVGSLRLVPRPRS